ncbi:MAG: hypothetical protein R3A78_16245 [Polyangiales bacterium]
MVYGDYGEMEEFLDTAERSVFQVAKERARSPYEHIKDVVLRTFTEIHEAAEHLMTASRASPSEFSTSTT